MDLSKNPVPDYDDYFSQVRTRDYAASLNTMVMFESSRGCWWGERSHCTFCALNALGMRYRSKPVPQVIDELRSLRDRYGIVNFGASDNILDRDSIDGLARELTERLPGITIFYDIRASVSREQMQALKRAGIIELEAGLENLSTPVLRRMAKATTGILNVRFLRRCAEFGIGLLWNYLYGFPGETIEEYEAVVPSIDPWLFHLHPPDVAFPVSLQRFAPYHSDPAKHNISITGPLPDYRYIHPSIDPRDLDDLAYYFEFSYLNGYDPTETARLMGRVVERWRAAYATVELRLEATVSGDGVVTIRDSRSGTERIHRLVGATALLYRLCESPVSVDELSRAALHLAPAAYLESRGSIHLILEKLTANGLLFREGDRFVAVAVPSGEFWLDLAKALPKVAPAPRPVAEAS
jgi:ribosomal peptide maturation radical SAM protein 1